MKYLIGTKIKISRNNLHLSQQDLSCKILSRSILSKIENNHIIPSIPQLKYLSSILKVSIDYLLDDNSINEIAININDNTTNSLSSLFQQKQFNTIIKYYEKSIIDISSNIDYLYYVGSAYYELDFYKESNILLTKFIKKFSELDNSQKQKYVENICYAFNLIAIINSYKKKYHKSIECILSAKDLIEKYNLTYHRIYQVLINNLGSLYNRLNKYKKCIYILESFLTDIPDLLNIRILAAIHLSLNTAYYNIGDYEKSIYHIKHAIYFFDYDNNSNDSNECYLNYINSLRYSNEYEEALDILYKFLLDKNLTLESNLKNSFSIQEIIIFFNMKKYDICLSLLSKLNLLRLDSYNRNSCYFIKGHIYYEKNDLDNSLKFLKKCEKFFKNSNYLYDIELLYQDLYKITCDDSYKIENIEEDYSSITARKNIVVP